MNYLSVSNEYMQVYILRHEWKKTWFQSFSIESAKYNRSIAEGLVDQLYERIHKDLKKNPI